MRVFVALICGVMLAFAEDHPKASAAYSAVKGKVHTYATKNTRRLFGSWNATGFATDPQARQAAKQAIATAAKTDADKVKMRMNEEQPGTAGRRLVGEKGMIIIDYLVEAENSTDAQAKHDLLNNTDVSMLTLLLTDALVAQGDGIYTLQVADHDVELASQADLEAFGAEVATDTAINEKAVAVDGGKGSSWLYWVVGGFGIAALALCAYFCIAYSQSGSGEKKKKKKDSTKRGVDITPETPPETASLAANPAPSPMYQPQQVVYNMPPQYMQPAQYFQYPELVQPVQYVQNAQYVQYIQPTELQPMAVASEPIQYVQNVAAAEMQPVEVAAVPAQ